MKVRCRCAPPILRYNGRDGKFRYDTIPSDPQQNCDRPVRRQTKPSLSPSQCSFFNRVCKLLIVQKRAGTSHANLYYSVTPLRPRVSAFQAFDFLQLEVSPLQTCAVFKGTTKHAVSRHLDHVGYVGVVARGVEYRVPGGGGDAGSRE
ncbi:unnamed protein product, partial [Ectocarpus sp. 13 AM-2016]